MEEAKPNILLSDLGKPLFSEERSKKERWESCYRKILFLGAEKQRLTAAGDVGHTGHDQE